MQDDESHLNVTTAGRTTVVELTDPKILDEISIAQIAERLTALVAEADKPSLIIDFARVAHMSSGALGMLITVHKRILEKAGELRLCSIQPTIYEVFVITRLNEVFQISPSRAEALESLK